MESNKKCSICGCKEIGEGKLSGYANMRSTNKVFTTGSEVIAYICTKCGHILSMRVKEPDRFKWFGGFLNASSILRIRYLDNTILLCII